jgi:hypothetical protein
VSLQSEWVRVSRCNTIAQDALISDLLPMSR